MAIRQLRYFGNPVLKTAAKPITTFDDATRRLVDDLMETVDQPGRAGLAAPQIGVSLRAFSYLVDDAHGYVINPELVELSEEEQEGDEGCLSVPGLWFPTHRAMRATVRGVDLHDNPITVSGEGLMARCLQHETDHLDGIVYLDRLTRPERRKAMREVRASDWFWNA